MTIIQFTKSLSNVRVKHAVLVDVVQPFSRKKARCPGEKPKCSLCHRLGQQCTYESQEPPNRIRGRGTSTNSDGLNVDGGEVRSYLSPPVDRLPPVDTLAAVMNGLPTAAHQTHAELDEAHSLSEIATAKEDLSSCYPLSTSLIQTEVEVYLDKFHDQPYCVFAEDWLRQNARCLPSETAFSLVGLTRRLTVNSPGTPDCDIPTGKFCAERAWKILSAQYQNGKMGLSFLQGTFLVAQLDFAGGNAHRGCASVALGLRTLQSFGFNQGRNLSSFTRSEAETRRRITWAFFMLDRTYNASRNYSLCLSDKHFTLCFPSPPDNSPAMATLHEKSMQQGHNVDQGIMVCLLRLYELWGKATEWVFEPFPTNILPPWQTGSALAILESEWMQFETQFADNHRYMNVDFKRRARHEPLSRPYLSTWLCVQFLFHSIQCLLHHPFVTMVKLRHLNENMSATFLQKSFETSLLHSRWIARFIKEMKEVELRVYDPFFGYLAAIAATIQLEHTGNKNPQIALLLNGEFRVLVDFITELSSYWENMGVLVFRINELAARRNHHGSLFYNQDGFSGALSSMPTPSNLPRMSVDDEALMWDILDFASSSSPLAATEAPSPALTRKKRKTPKHPTGRSTRQGDLHAPVDLESPGSAAAPSHSGPVLGELGSQLGNDEPISEWDFPDRAGSHAPGLGVPDIPDWMVFGDFLSEHL
ncbi:uncharacterized protein N7482_010572 [Penicillium canariense]|uniref:Transcription factor n=1 Tax=Penicillium canariense TaxID=189055 RepID=A0A9W9HM41_9EURO|nr:uncharacterized protein N7482_010572 [Penicillium canariense]KAJ5151320.1 hypothetical protein N7482_010572 [Penicillium canariense]